MSNSLGTANTGKIISQKVPYALLAAFPALAQFANNYAPDQLLWGQSVVVKKRGLYTASDFDPATGYAGATQPLGMTDILVTLNKWAVMNVQLNDEEQTSTDIDFIGVNAQQIAYALGLHLFGNLFAQVNVGGTQSAPTGFVNETVIANAAYTRSSASVAMKALNDRNVVPFNRIVILNNTAAESLQQDFQIVGNYDPTNKLVTEADLPRVAGADHSRYSALPAGTQSLFGIAAHADALAIATRLPKTPKTDLNINGIIETIDGPIPIQLRRWYDMDLGVENYTNTFMYGVSQGVTEALQRLVTAANTLPA
jgi:hypothetical protein